MVFFLFFCYLLFLFENHFYLLLGRLFERWLMLKKMIVRKKCRFVVVCMNVLKMG